MSAQAPFYQANDGLLRRTLTANATLCLAGGLSMVLAAGVLAPWLSPLSTGLFDLSTETLVRLAGLDVTAFALLCWWTARRRPLSRALAFLAIVLEVVWVVGAAFLMIAYPAALTGLGFWLVGATAILALDFALLQSFGLWQLYQGRAKLTLENREGTFHLRAEATVDAPLDVAWRVMADQAGYAEVADNIAEVKVVEGQGLGMIRQCRDTAGRSWRERCTEWEEGRAFAFEVDTAAPDYPYPIELLQGRWSMAPAGDLVTQRMDFVIRPRAGWVAALQFRVLLALLLPVCDRLLANWAARMQAETERAWSSPGLRKIA